MIPPFSFNYFNDSVTVVLVNVVEVIVTVAVVEDVKLVVVTLVTVVVEDKLNVVLVVPVLVCLMAMWGGPSQRHRGHHRISWMWRFEIFWVIRESSMQWSTRPSSTLLAVPVREILQCNVRLAMIAICGLYESIWGQFHLENWVCSQKKELRLAKVAACLFNFWESCTGNKNCPRVHHLVSDFNLSISVSPSLSTLLSQNKI